MSKTQIYTDETRLGKARTVVRAIDKLWKSKIMGRATKIGIFNTNVNAFTLALKQNAASTEQMAKMKA